jgi:pimeloyl-[acyl-carrier protein] methyl ester esterase
MFFEHNGVKLFYEDKGKGPETVIFVHGLMMTHDVWKAQVEFFSKDFRVVSLDLRGFGKSDKPETPYTFEIFTGDILALIKELELEKPALVGWSMGASIGIVYAAKYPETLSRVVLVDGTPLFVATDDFPHAVPPEGAGELVRGLQADFVSGARSFVELMFPEPGVEDVKDFVFEITQRNPVESVLNCLQNVGGVDLRGYLPKIQLPMLILCGGRDRVCMPEASRYVHEKIAGSRLHVFPGKGHAPFLTDANSFNEELKAFLTV